MSTVSRSTMMMRELAKAKNIQKSLGLRNAAKFMFNRGYSLDCALFVLLGCEARD